MDVGGEIVEGADAPWAEETPAEGVGNVPFREPHRAVRGVRLPNLLQEPGKACPKLHGVGGGRFFGGRVDGRGNIIC